jgi:hypothetical protein
VHAWRLVRGAHHAHTRSSERQHDTSYRGLPTVNRGAQPPTAPREEQPTGPDHRCAPALAPTSRLRSGQEQSQGWNPTRNRPQQELAQHLQLAGSFASASATRRSRSRSWSHSNSAAAASELTTTHNGRAARAQRQASRPIRRSPGRARSTRAGRRRIGSRDRDGAASYASGCPGSRSLASYWLLAASARLVWTWAYTEGAGRLRRDARVRRRRIAHRATRRTHPDDLAGARVPAVLPHQAGVSLGYAGSPTAGNGAPP